MIIFGGTQCICTFLLIYLGRMTSVWSLDNVFIGGSLMTPDMLYETFDTEPNTDMWSFWPNGRVAEYCLFNTGSVFTIIIIITLVQSISLSTSDVWSGLCIPARPVTSPACAESESESLTSVFESESESESTAVESESESGFI